MNSISRAGGPSPLDVLIESKVFSSADGSRSEILRDLSFRLEPASFTCLIGPSGCGKTTTLRIVLGLDSDFAGKVSLPGGDTRLSAVFQEPRLLPWRTVDENVRLALSGEQPADLDALYGVLGLRGREARYPSELSLGLERRVALARAFAVMPDILLLDEPFVSLDEHTADRLRELLVELAAIHRVTVLMVTHNVREAVRIADRLLLINGRPAKVVGDVPIMQERGSRSPSEQQAILEQLASTYPDSVRI